MSNPFAYDISKGADDFEDEFVGQCPQCGNDVLGDQGYEVCKGCNAPFHTGGCLYGLYIPGVGFWCILCANKGV